MNILCIGQLVYDITFPCETSLIENQKYRIYDRIECMGAPAANAAYLCALWGINTSLIARIGNDLYGKEIIEALQKVNLNTKFLHIEKQHPTSISCIIANTSNGNRTILNSPMKELSFPVKFPTEDADIILMDGHEKEASLTALKHYPHATTILDAGTFKPEIIELINAVDYLVCSQDFAFQYTNIKIDINDKHTIEETFSKLKEINQNNIIITLGDQGCLYEEKKSYVHINAFKTHAIDTTGAGDIFHGSFAYCLAKHYTLKDTILISSLASSISVESIGGNISIPTLQVLKKRIKELNLHLPI